MERREAPGASAITRPGGPAEVRPAPLRRRLAPSDVGGQAPPGAPPRRFKRDHVLPVPGSVAADSRGIKWVILGERHVCS